ncbi:Mor transcription activator family protein [Romboutsia sp.]|uniref:Mor transcription activator family protein n=1 Tax=Romboutsia sp. TaxID=1965302 RepID=UPI003F3C4D96
MNFESEKLDGIIEIVGMEKFKELCRFYGGHTVYFPLQRSVEREERNKEIVGKFNGVNFENLATLYGMSVTHVRRILKENGRI